MFYLSWLLSAVENTKNFQEEKQGWGKFMLYKQRAWAQIPSTHVKRWARQHTLVSLALGICRDKWIHKTHWPGQPSRLCERPCSKRWGGGGGRWWRRMTHTPEDTQCQPLASTYTSKDTLTCTHTCTHKYTIYTYAHTRKRHCINTNYCYHRMANLLFPLTISRQHSPFTLELSSWCIYWFLALQVRAAKTWARFTPAHIHEIY